MHQPPKPLAAVPNRYTAIPVAVERGRIAVLRGRSVRSKRVWHRSLIRRRRAIRTIILKRRRRDIRAIILII